MVSIRKCCFTLCFIAFWLLISSWGFLVHKTVHQLAVYELPKSIQPFFYKNMGKLVYDAPRPDIRRNTDSTEATKHFIDLEAYGNNSVNEMPIHWKDAVKKYSKDSLLKYGYVPYHVIYMKGKLTEAFRLQNKDSILFYAADLGHYIADANVPLHTTINYDGQLTAQVGLHGLWESMIPEIEIANYDLYSKHHATYLRKPDEAIWKAVRRAAALLPELFAKEKETSASFSDAQKYRIQMRRGKEYKSYTSEFAKAYAASLKNSINQQLIFSANLIADFYYTAWVDAGKPDLSDINREYSEADKSQLKEDLQSYKQNQLLPTQKLMAKKTVLKEE
ncbi:MAG: hypothetical protein K2Q21_02605 [Chitinophagaceae bacterium]|nr:hypothetical protein [Chitinophagaceae bacterium]